eukprot:4657794-Prorocentrum_lima.AAC.1
MLVPWRQILTLCSSWHWQNLQSPSAWATQKSKKEAAARADSDVRSLWLGQNKRSRDAPR